MTTDDPRPPHFSLLRTFGLPDLLTLGNAACGMAAVLLAMRFVATGERAAIWAAFGLLPLALALDVADGAVARARGGGSPLGGDLDSLADVVSFGVAPAALGAALGLDTWLDGVVLVYFVACGISRLARFNVTAAALAGPSGKVRYYEGTPIPTSLLLVAGLAVCFGRGATGDALPLGRTGGALAFHPIVLAFALSGTLMASARVRIPKP